METPITELHRRPEVLAEAAANAVTDYLDKSGITDPVEAQRWIAIVFDKVEAKALTH